jgi:hypothetical protein
MSKMMKWGIKNPVDNKKKRDKEKGGKYLLVPAVLRKDDLERLFY